MRISFRAEKCTGLARERLLLAFVGITTVHSAVSQDTISLGSCLGDCGCNYDAMTTHGPNGAESRIYNMQPALLNGKPHWATDDGSWFIYWTPCGSGDGAEWRVDHSETAGACDEGAFHIQSDADIPPDYRWYQNCKQCYDPYLSSWACQQPGERGYIMMSSVEIEFQLSDPPPPPPSDVDSCRQLATTTLAQPACKTVPARLMASTGVSSEDQPCTVGCAEVWLQAASQCAGGNLETSFEAVAPAGMTLACSAAASSLLATAPSRLSIVGFTCHPAMSSPVEFVLQPIPLNGKPHYVGASVDNTWHVYWAFRGANSAAPCWVIDDDTTPGDPQGRDYPSNQPPVAKITSSSDVPPIGSAVWWEFCHNADNVNARLTLTSSSNEEDCQAEALASSVVALCCSEYDPLTCGAHDVPQECSVDCAHRWAQSLDHQCPPDFGIAGSGDSDMATFLTSECELLSLTVMTDTAVVEVTQTHTFPPFETQSGTRYEVTLRVGRGSGQLTRCTSNALDGPNGQGPGSCDRVLSQGASCANNLCATCGPNSHLCDDSCGFLCPQEGITGAALRVLPASSSQTIAESTGGNGPDKTIGFTATTDRHTVSVQAFAGSGPVTVTVEAVGTAVERSPHVQVDGLPHSVIVDCLFSACHFGYDGVDMTDGDGSAFDLVLPHAEAGRAYAILVELPPGPQNSGTSQRNVLPGRRSGGRIRFQGRCAGGLGGMDNNTSFVVAVLWKLA